LGGQCWFKCGDLDGPVGMISLFQTLRGSSSIVFLRVTRLCHSDAIYRRESSEESVHNYNEDARSLPFEVSPSMTVFPAGAGGCLDRRVMNSTMLNNWDVRSDFMHNGRNGLQAHSCAIVGAGYAPR